MASNIKKTTSGKLKITNNRKRGNKAPVKTAPHKQSTALQTIKPEDKIKDIEKDVVLSENKNVEPDTVTSKETIKEIENNNPEKPMKKPDQKNTDSSGNDKMPEPKPEPKKEFKIKFESNKVPDFKLPDDKEGFSPLADEPIIRDSGASSNFADNTQPLSQEPVLPEPDISPDDTMPNSNSCMADKPTPPQSGNGGNVGSDNIETAETLGSDNELGEGAGSDAGEGKGQGLDNVNPNLNDISPEDKLRAAQAAAIQLTKMYCTYKPKLFKLIGKPNKKKIEKKIQSGELDPNVIIKTLDSEKTFKQHIIEVDEQCETIFTPTEDFKKELIPPLTRVLLEHKVGLTDAQQCLVIAGQDVATSIITLIEIKNYQKELTEAASDLTEQVKVNLKEKNAQITQKDREIAELHRKLDEANKKAESAEKKPYKGEKNNIVEDAQILSETKTTPKTDEGDL